ncbi:hypothetical protein [Geotalea sp. SG265]|uniref:hypothetical protein n=1 Tax=Geotalea sp. SG265 TaxID=2922867 RepID=UPI001FAFEDFC|nr:hypothetical protein [Geotalea sp. SG265]
MWEQEFGTEMQEQGENYELFGELPEMSGEYQGEMPLSEMQEMELAAELLTLGSDRELEQFLGSLIKKAAGFVKGPIGQALGGVLKGIAKKALPIVGGAIGSFVAPGVGTAIGSSLGSAAGKMFGLELEGMSNEDKEFEVARRYVRFASAAARRAASAPPRLSPYQIAKQAVSYAARRYAPGLVMYQNQQSAEPWNGWNDSGSSDFQQQDQGERRSGRWIRRGRNIIIFGV